jgi:glycosyltransferase involved in cell wall biosynthesis
VVQAILYTNPDGVPPIINSARILAKSGFRVNMICRDYKEQWGITYPPGVEVRRVKKRSNSGWRELVDFIAEVVRSADPSASVIVGHEMHGFLPARILATLRRRPLVYHCHDFVERGRPISGGAQLVRTFERRFARTADMVIVPDADRAQVMVRELRLRRQPVIVANAPLARNSNTGEELRSALQQAGKHFARVVLRQGVIGPGHGIEMTLRSIPHWASQHWGFVLLGRSTPEYLRELAALIQSLGVESQVAILPPVAYDRVASFTPGADVGHAMYDPVNVNHVYMGTASNKLMEYMAAGLPVLVSDTEQFRRFMETYECGLAVDAGSPQCIARAVNSLLEDPERSATLGQNGARAFEQVFSYERQFAPVLESISILSQSGKRSMIGLK